MTKWAPNLVSWPKPPRRRLKDEDWTKNGRKDKIVKLRESNVTCVDIQRIMKDEYNFDATICQYKARFKEWGLREYFNDKQRRYILRERARRGKMPVFIYKETKRLVDQNKVDRLWENRHRFETISPDGSLSPGGLTTVSTPSPPSCQAEIPDELPWSAAVYEDANSIPEADVIMPDALHEDLEDGVELFRTIDTAAENQVVVNGSVPWSKQRADRCEPPRVTLVNELVSSLATGDIIGVLTRVLEILNIPLDYCLDDLFGQRVHGAPADDSDPVDETRMDICRPQSPWRASLGDISPMTPNSVELFMRWVPLTLGLLSILHAVSCALDRLVTDDLDLEYRSIEVTSVTSILSEVNKLLGNSNTRSTALPKRSFGKETNFETSSIVFDLESGSPREAESSSMSHTSETFGFDADSLEESPLPDTLSSNTTAKSKPVRILNGAERDELCAVKTYLNAARSLSWDGKALEAIPFLESALESPVFSERFGFGSLAFLDANYELYSCFTAMDPIGAEHVEMARNTMEMVSQAYECELGLMHWKTRRSYLLLGRFLEIGGDLDEALGILNLVLLERHIKEFRTGEDPLLDFDTLVEQAGLLMSDVYHRMNNHGAAIEIKENLLTRSTERRQYGYSDTDPNGLRYSLAKSLMGVGDYGMALYHLKELGDFYRGISGCELPEALLARVKAAECLLELDMAAEAQLESESVHSHLLVMSQSNSLSPSQWRLLGDLLITSADAHSYQKDFTSALRYYFDSLRVYALKIRSKTEYNARVATARICEVLIDRGPVFYIRPLAHYHIDIQKKFNQPVSTRVMKWLALQEAITNQSSAVVTAE